jgi:hypothetical protein
MRTMALFIALLFCALRATVPEIVQDEGIHVLTDANFDSFLSQHKFAFIEFYV